MNDFNPDDWDSHWTNSNASASISPAQIYRHRVITKVVQKLNRYQLVDIGCGQGDFLERLDQEIDGIRLSGVELSDTGARITRAKVPGATIFQADLMQDNPKIENVSANTIGTCLEVLEHLDDPIKFLNNAKRLLANNAFLVVSVPSGPRTEFDKHIGHRRHYTPKSLREMLTNAGFTEVKVRRCGWPFFNLYRFMVYLRGKKLIEDVEIKTIETSFVAKIVSTVFNFLCRFNLPIPILGWQLVAICRYQE